MALTYHIIQRPNPKNPGEKNWYPLIKHDKKIVELEDLSAHMSNHHTPYSPGAILGILTDMVGCIRELTLEGKQVRLPNLAIFGLTVASAGVQDPDEFNITALVRKTRLAARATGTFRPSEIKGEVSFNEADNYTSPRTVKEDTGNTEVTDENPEL